MIDRLLGVVAPHYCTSCGEIGAIFCQNCKYNIAAEPYESCIFCNKLCHEDNICGQCSVVVSRAWCVGERSEALEKLLNTYKFERSVGAADALADLLAIRLPHVLDVRIVPIPTVPRHVRQRGYDHAALIAKAFAARRGLPYDACLRRKTDTQQRGATRAQRKVQAAEAFVAHNVQPGVIYLIIDDIVTTGATLQAAARVLRGAGAADVWVAVVAHQPWTADA